MEPRTLARPYARAIFEIASAEDARGDWGSILEALAVTLGAPGLAQQLRSPLIDRDGMADIIADALFGHRGGQTQATTDRDAAREAQVRALLRLLAENRRLSLVPLVAEHFKDLCARAEARVDVDVVTATDTVPPEQQDALQQAIGRRLARTVVLHWSADPALIGGALIRAGDWVVDGSLRGELQRLSQELQR
ncbi:MAG TPA: F0F1 ATP synthase subunit delta [Nevskiaceae bacterium]